MTTNERKSAYIVAYTAITLDNAGDAAGHDLAMNELWAVAGYWRTPRTSTTAERMIRFPAGRAQPWRTHRTLAAQAWAAIA